MKEAVAKMKAELGDDAVILHTKKYKEGGLLGLGSREMVEITAAIEDEKPVVKKEPERPQRSPIPVTVLSQYKTNGTPEGVALAEKELNPQNSRSSLSTENTNSMNYNSAKSSSSTRANLNQASSLEAAMNPSNRISKPDPPMPYDEPEDSPMPYELDISSRDDLNSNHNEAINSSDTQNLPFIQAQSGELNETDVENEPDENVYTAEPANLTDNSSKDTNLQATDTAITSAISTVASVEASTNQSNEIQQPQQVIQPQPQNQQGLQPQQQNHQDLQSQSQIQPQLQPQSLPQPMQQQTPVQIPQPQMQNTNVSAPANPQNNFEATPQTPNVQSQPVQPMAPVQNSATQNIPNQQQMQFVQSQPIQNQPAQMQAIQNQQIPQAQIHNNQEAVQLSSVQAGSADNSTTMQSNIQNSNEQTANSNQQQELNQPLTTAQLAQAQAMMMAQFNQLQIAQAMQQAMAQAQAQAQQQISQQVYRQQQVRSESQPKAEPSEADQESQQKIKKLENEIAQMKALLAQVIGKDSNRGSISLHEALRRQEVNENILNDMAAHAEAGETLADSQSREAKSTLMKFLNENVNFSEGIKLNRHGVRIVSLLGTTGVGKTTTLAKIAAKFVLEQGITAALITADTYRISAVEQLRTYSDILGLPLEIVYSPNELSKAINKHRNRDLILIDTAGRSQHNDYQMKELQEFLAANQRIEKHLVLSTTTKISDAKDIIEKFSVCEPEKIIFTKTDETASVGLILNLLYKQKLPLSYVTNGQSVPDDITPANAEILADLLLKRNI